MALFGKPKRTFWELFCHSDEETWAFFCCLRGKFLHCTEVRKNKHFSRKKWKMEKIRRARSARRALKREFFQSFLGGDRGEKRKFLSYFSLLLTLCFGWWPWGYHAKVTKPYKNQGFSTLHEMLACREINLAQCEHMWSLKIHRECFKINQNHPKNQLLCNSGLRLKNTTFQDPTFYPSFDEKKTYWQISALTQLHRKPLFFQGKPRKNAKIFAREARVKDAIWSWNCSYAKA